MTWRDGGIEGPITGRIDEALEKQALIFKDTFVGALGVRIDEAHAGYAVASVDVGPNVVHPGGYAHGGAIASLGDTAAAWATFPALRADDTYTTIEFKTNFLRGVTGGRLRAEAKAVHTGRRTMVLEVRITADDRPDRLVALMSVTQAIIPLTEGRPDQAAARP